MSTAMIPLHPQPVPGRPGDLRWVVPAGVLTGTGHVTTAPGRLADLLADGTLARITVEPAAVVTSLGPDHGWEREGARVRTALHAALEEPAGWIMATEADAGSDGGEDGDGAGGRADGDDALLRAAVRETLAGQVGDFARSHGGTIELVDVTDGVVTVRLGGTCHGCPASWFTLHLRLERALRRRHPGLREIRNTGGVGAAWAGFGAPRDSTPRDAGAR